MQLKITLKPGKLIKDAGCGFAEAALINGVAIEDSTVSKVIRYSEPVEYLRDGIIVKFNSWDLPFKILERIWPLVSHEQRENRRHYMANFK